MNVPGRQYPVSIYYTREPEADFVDAALITCLQVRHPTAHRPLRSPLPVCS